ncbi:glycoside hydrolase [Nocardioides sp. Root1257]|uniref:glycoside hydrolase family 43 protein n=1 Tax=unclassified Nocardioides TaxID=2615069 RepID=UPI0006FB10DD|nr:MULTISPECIES: glycoside hydrolase family 43 protein [unclassified Nocardioides]KQW47267.1 glycoside hydrolase [Nocardioides sp. Root1257]KRC45423.1 glycoside hydrolase [Nocardioides sp. Root224]
MTPLLSGFNPDPSIVRVDDAYYLVTSTFEYLPGLPVYRSADLLSWELVGHVITRPEQAGLDDVPTPGGVWAPTIRHRDGIYYVTVTIMMGGRGCVVYTATDPAGPWSDGVQVPAVTGIDPDLAWDENGTAYVTFADFPRELQQVRVDLATGEALGPARPVWKGSGLYAPEGPHLYRRGEWWYLLAAEGGTDRGHVVTIARSASPDGPFESSPHNPVISARSTGSPVQNVGHADLVSTDDGDAMVLLGVRPVGLAQAFSPLGRETFLASVSWTEGWPIATLRDVPGSDPGVDWISVRRTPSAVGVPVGGRVTITGDGRGMDDPRPWFVGRRQAHLGATFSAVVDASAGTGGVAARHDETHFLTVSASGGTVTATAALAGFSRTWTADVGPGELRLGLDLERASRDFRDGDVGAGTIRFWAAVDGERRVLAEVDGRYWSFEVAKSFTGRVLGVFAEAGTVDFSEIEYVGRD